MTNAWEFRLFVDEQCPVCRREGAWLRRLDGGRGRLDLVDISDPRFDAATFGIRTSVIDEIHGQHPDGRIVRGLSAFRGAYAAVGKGWLLAPTSWPGFRMGFDLAYRLFARCRVRFAGGRCAPEGVCRVR